MKIRTKKVLWTILISIVLGGLLFAIYYLPVAIMRIVVIGLLFVVAIYWIYMFVDLILETDKE